MTEVCVIGGGGQVAEGVSALLAGRGHRITHYRPGFLPIPGVPRRPPRPLSRLERFAVHGEPQAAMDDGAARYQWVSRSEVRGCEVFVFCLPSYLAEFIGFQLAPALRHKHIVNVSDRFMGTVALCRAAELAHPGWRPASAVAFNSPPLLAYQRRRDAVTSLLYSKPFVLAAPVHQAMRKDAGSVIKEIFGLDRIRWMDTTLDLAFENINSIVHAVQDLECLRGGHFGVEGSLYDPALYTEKIVARINEVTRDRDQVASAYTRHVYRDLRTFDATTFQVPGLASPGTAGYRHGHGLLSTVPRPETFTAHGYEDVGWSMVPLESAGRLAGVPTPALSTLIDDWNTLMNVDYRLVGRTASALGLARPIGFGDGK
ncbi:hypothetical protein [Actinomadura craniellae]|uniref:hypothetical protein n=1 Tax=Actinomadura craniellae TaxID=2231787 RepID=UPI0011BE84CD|nr:hypothetical protein [Actinomadura craniellae]